MLGYSSFKQFKEEVVMEDAKQTVKSRLALYAMAKAENISLTDADKEDLDIQQRVCRSFEQLQNRRGVQGSI